MSKVVLTTGCSTNDKILITYASRSGSTAEIAEAIGKTLIQNGLSVEVLPIQAVNSLTVRKHNRNAVYCLPFSS